MNTLKDSNHNFHGDELSLKVIQFPDGIHENFYSQCFNSSETTSLEQRICQPLMQPRKTLGMHPQRLKISSKQFKRCRYCQHILCRPDLNVSSIRFKILHSATLLVPVLNVLSFPFSVSQGCFRLPLLISNPTLDPLTIQIHPNNYLSSIAYVVPRDYIELSGKEEDHSFEYLDNRNERLSGLLYSSNGPSVRLFFEISSVDAHIASIYFSIDCITKKQNVVPTSVSDLPTGCITHYLRICLQYPYQPTS
ncbi:hypothetical protein LOD99_8060 [Oopsacas minuta]|uniref:Dynactin subunit 4 n=1 Tax=Oopsacas minuta TaxID=111878 RepID=A0AAV7JJF1_9METZ|nr:hypothetical protein LOD99_8060 [Oopsacas minuta]